VSTVGNDGVGIMNSTAFSLSFKDNSKIDGNQITFGAMDFQPHTTTLDLFFANLDQEMDLMIRSFNFRIGSLGSIRVLDPVNSGPSAGKIAVTNSKTSIGFDTSLTYL
jgi:hypothetical protein